MGIRQGYSKEFKQEAIRLADQSINKSGVAWDLGTHLSLLRRWEQQLTAEGEKAFPGGGNSKQEVIIEFKEGKCASQAGITNGNSSGFMSAKRKIFNQLSRLLKCIN